MMVRILLVVAACLAGCSALSAFEEPRYDPGPCGFRMKSCGDRMTCCPMDHRCDNKRGLCVYDPDTDNPWAKYSRDAGRP